MLTRPILRTCSEQLLSREFRYVLPIATNAAAYVSGGSSSSMRRTS
jgi:hypothetical protein